MSNRDRVRRIALGLILWASLSGCSYLNQLHAPLTPQEELVTDVWPILNDARRREIRQCASPEAVKLYLDAFWKEMDPSPGTEDNEYRTEYESRLDYVRTHYPYQQGWTFDDRARVYLIYGPPDDVYFNPWIPRGNCGAAQMKAVEMWIYNIMIPTNPPPTIYDFVAPNLVKFVFADNAYIGRYTQIYSNVPGELVDPDIYSTGAE